MDEVIIKIQKINIKNNLELLFKKLNFKKQYFKENTEKIIKKGKRKRINRLSGITAKGTIEITIDTINTIEIGDKL